jgi:hypothetical protein
LFVLATSAFAGQFKVTRVCDGDTVKAEGHDVEIKVRLMGMMLLRFPARKGRRANRILKKPRNT